MCCADTASMVLQIDLVSQVDMSSSNISVVRVIGKKRGRARVAIAYTDGTVSTHRDAHACAEGAIRSRRPAFRFRRNGVVAEVVVAEGPSADADAGTTAGRHEKQPSWSVCRGRGRRGGAQLLREATWRVVLGFATLAAAGYGPTDADADAVTDPPTPMPTPIQYDWSNVIQMIVSLGDAAGEVPAWLPTHHLPNHRCCCYLCAR